MIRQVNDFDDGYKCVYDTDGNVRLAVQRPEGGGELPSEFRDLQEHWQRRHYDPHVEQWLSIDPLDLDD